MLSLQGVIPPLVTPLAEDGEIDVPALAPLVEHVLAGGVHGIFILGTMGEGAPLSDEQRPLLLPPH